MSSIIEDFTKVFFVFYLFSSAIMHKILVLESAT